MPYKGSGKTLLHGSMKLRTLRADSTYVHWIRP